MAEAMFFDLFDRLTNLTLWEIAKGIITIGVILFVVNQWFIPKKKLKTTNSEQRIKKRYRLFYNEALRASDPADRQQLQLTLNNTAKNASVPQCSTLRQRKPSQRSKKVMVEQEKNVYYEHVRPEDAPSLDFLLQKIVGHILSNESILQETPEKTQNYQASQ